MTSSLLLYDILLTVIWRLAYSYMSSGLLLCDILQQRSTQLAEFLSPKILEIFSIVMNKDVLSASLDKTFPTIFQNYYVKLYYKTAAIDQWCMHSLDAPSV